MPRLTTSQALNHLVDSGLLSLFDETYLQKCIERVQNERNRLLYFREVENIRLQLIKNANTKP